MGGTFNRLISRPDDNIIDGSADDAEFDNIINNLDPSGIGSNTIDAVTMQSVADPYPSNVISLPIDLEGEITRLRYQIKEILGELQWYSDAKTSLSDLFFSHKKITTKTSTDALIASEAVIIAIPASSFTLTLPSVSGLDGKLFYFSHGAANTNEVTINGGGSTVGGNSSRKLTSQGDYLVLVCDESNSNWAVLAKSELKRIPEYKNLRVQNNSANPSYQIDVDAEALDVVNAGGDLLRLLNVNLTASMASLGGNGLDTGVLTTDTTYAIWVIHNPDTGSVAALLSVSFIFGGLTLPSGYTYARLVDFCRISTGSTEYLNETNFATNLNWDVSGDFDDTGGDADYTHSSGVGTLTQTNADLNTVGLDDSLFVFDYEVISPSGDVALKITNSFASSDEALSSLTGNRSLVFLSAVAASVADFVIDGNSSNGGVIIDNVSLKTASIIPFQSFNGIHLYDNPEDDTSILGAVNSPSFSDVDCSSFAGDSVIASHAIISLECYTTATGSSYYLRFRPKGSSAINGKMVARIRKSAAAQPNGNYGQYQSTETIIALDSSLLFQYKLGSNAYVIAHVAGVHLNV